MDLEWGQQATPAATKITAYYCEERIALRAEVSTAPLSCVGSRTWYPIVSGFEDKLFHSPNDGGSELDRTLASQKKS
jgi:hypothetical protein